MTTPQHQAANATPASLLLRLRQPSETRAWNDFVDLYTPLIYRWARGVGLQEPDAADLVQDVFALLLVKLPEFRYDRRKERARSADWAAIASSRCWAAAAWASSSPPRTCV